MGGDLYVMVTTNEVSIQTKGDGDVLDLTGRVIEGIEGSGVTSGTAVVAVVGSTAGITTMEYEPGLVADIRKAFDRIAPSGVAYEHDARWGDGNGHSHVRASVLGPSITVPIVSGRLALGTWQQVVLIDFDTRPRMRKIVIQVVGE